MWNELDMALAIACVATRTLVGLPVERIDAKPVPCWAVYSSESAKNWRYIIATCTRLFATIEGTRFQFGEYEGQSVAERLLEEMPFVPDAVDWAWEHVLRERERIEA